MLGGLLSDQPFTPAPTLTHNASVGNEVAIPGTLKRAFLRQCAERAKAATLTLREVLVLVQGEIFTPNFQRGRILINTSGSGQSGSFEIG